VGVDFSPGALTTGESAEEIVLIPISVMQRVYNYGNDVHFISFTAKDGVKVGELTDRIRQVITYIDEHYTENITVQQLAQLAGKLHALSPLQVLSRGYAAVQKDGEWLSDGGDLQPGDRIAVRFIDGEADCTVTQVRSMEE
jgi:exonuclease VII large subunit